MRDYDFIQLREYAYPYVLAEFLPILGVLEFVHRGTDSRLAVNARRGFSQDLST